MDIATRTAIQQLVAEVEQLKKTLRDKPNRETGGQWLTLAAYTQLSPFSAGTEVPFMTTIPRSGAIRRVCVAAFVATTNTGSAYWNITLKTASGNVVTVNTSAIAANTWTVLSADYGAMAFSDVVQSTDKYFQIAVTKTGTPGNLSLASPVVYFI